jgi:hypothetical protein
MTNSKTPWWWQSNPDPEAEQNIIITNAFPINKKIDKRFFVVDNFFEDPYAVREFALNQKYFDGEGAVGCRTKKQFLWDGLREKFEEIIGEKISDHTHDGYGWNDIGINGRFQSCKAGTPMVFHCDTQRWAGVLFLTPDAPPQSGTSFYRNKKSKVFHNSQVDWTVGENGNAFNGKTFLDPTPYERIDTVGNVFNRLVIFDGGLIHAGNDYFGWDLESSRLFQIFFFDSPSYSITLPKLKNKNE